MNTTLRGFEGPDCPARPVPTEFAATAAVAADRSKLRLDCIAMNCNRSRYINSQLQGVHFQLAQGRSMVVELTWRSRPKECLDEKPSLVICSFCISLRRPRKCPAVHADSAAHLQYRETEARRR